MTLCPIALAVGCKKCPVFSICPLKGVIGDQGKDTDNKPSDTKPAAAKRAAAKPGGTKPDAARAAPAKRRKKGR